MQTAPGLRGGKTKLDLAEGTGDGFRKNWHQIGHQGTKSIGEDFGAAPETSGKPRMRGLGRGIAAGQRDLGKGKVAEAALLKEGFRSESSFACEGGRVG